MQIILKNGNLLNPKETVPIALCRILKRDRYNLTVSKKGHSADPLIIRYADRNNLTVLSNDKFDKSFDDKFFIMAAARLKQKGLIRRVGVVEGKLTIM
jgi:predicted nuclease of predicted toxin-antitoxin system